MTERSRGSATRPTRLSLSADAGPREPAGGVGCRAASSVRLATLSWSPCDTASFIRTPGMSRRLPARCARFRPSRVACSPSSSPNVRPDGPEQTATSCARRFRARDSRGSGSSYGTTSTCQTPRRYGFRSPSPPASRALDGIGSPAILMSTSVPYSAHLAALSSRGERQLPWVAEFRDPWSQIDDNVRTAGHGCGRQSMRALERRVVDSASALVVTSDETRAELLSMYSVAALGSRVGDPQRLRSCSTHAVVRRTRGSAELLHAGSVPGEASVEPLLRGVEQSPDATPSACACGSWARPMSGMQPRRRSEAAHG